MVFNDAQYLKKNYRFVCWFTPQCPDFSNLQVTISPTKIKNMFQYLFIVEERIYCHCVSAHEKFHLNLLIHKHSDSTHAYQYYIDDVVVFHYP